MGGVGGCVWVCECVCVCVCVCVCGRMVGGCGCVRVVHWHCSAQLSMFNMERRYNNKIIIIIIIIILTYIGMFFICIVASKY